MLRAIYHFSFLLYSIFIDLHVPYKVHQLLSAIFVDCAARHPNGGTEHDVCVATMWMEFVYDICFWRVILWIWQVLRRARELWQEYRQHQQEQPRKRQQQQQQLASNARMQYHDVPQPNTNHEYFYKGHYE